jgi:uncharacterized cupredoxin-like copper-binding protein
MNRHAFLTSLAPAALALTAAACVGTATAPAAGSGPSGALENDGPPAAGGTDRSVQEVTVAALDSMRFEPAALTVEAGRPVRLTLRNWGTIPHDFTLTQGLPRPLTLVAGAGATSVSAPLILARPGTYQFVCAQPGHAQAGMQGTITATRAGSAGAGSTTG